MITAPHNDRERYQLERLKNWFYVLWGAWVCVLGVTTALFGIPAIVGGMTFGLLAAIVESVWEMRIVHGPGWWR